MAAIMPTEDFAGRYPPTVANQLGRCPFVRHRRRRRRRKDCSRGILWYSEREATSQLFFVLRIFFAVKSAVIVLLCTGYYQMKWTSWIVVLFGGRKQSAMVMWIKVEWCYLWKALPHKKRALLENRQQRGHRSEGANVPTRYAVLVRRPRGMLMLRDT